MMEVLNTSMFFQRGYTALHLAAKEKKIGMVNLLGILGADCNIENEVNALKTVQQYWLMHHCLG